MCSDSKRNTHKAKKRKTPTPEQLYSKKTETTYLVYLHSPYLKYTFYSHIYNTRTRMEMYLKNFRL